MPFDVTIPQLNNSPLSLRLDVGDVRSRCQRNRQIGTDVVVIPSACSHGPTGFCAPPNVVPIKQPIPHICRPSCCRAEYLELGSTTNGAMDGDQPQFASERRNL